MGGGFKLAQPSDRHEKLMETKNFRVIGRITQSFEPRVAQMTVMCPGANLGNQYHRLVNSICGRFIHKRRPFPILRTLDTSRRLEHL